MGEETSPKPADATVEPTAEMAVEDPGVPVEAATPDLATSPDRVPEPSPTDRIASLLQQVEQRLTEVFERKLAYDAHKDKQIDRQHEELQRLRSDLVFKAVRPVFVSLIRMHYEFWSVLETLERKRADEITTEHLIGLLKSFRDDVELMLDQNGAVAFRTEGAHFDPRRQRAMRRVETAEAGQIGQVAAHILPGFDYGGTILEKERVAVFIEQTEPQREPNT